MSRHARRLHFEAELILKDGRYCGKAGIVRRWSRRFYPGIPAGSTVCISNTCRAGFRGNLTRRAGWRQGPGKLRHEQFPGWDVFGSVQTEEGSIDRHVVTVA